MLVNSYAIQHCTVLRISVELEPKRRLMHCIWPPNDRGHHGGTTCNDCNHVHFCNLAFRTQFALKAKFAHRTEPQWHRREGDTGYNVCLSVRSSILHCITLHYITYVSGVCIHTLLKMGTHEEPPRAASTVLRINCRFKY